MTKEDIFQTIGKLMKSINPAKTQLQRDADIELELNSIEFVQLISALEVEYDIEFEFEKLSYAAFSVLDNMVDYVLELLG